MTQANRSRIPTRALANATRWTLPAALAAALALAAVAALEAVPDGAGGANRQPLRVQPSAPGWDARHGRDASSRVRHTGVITSPPTPTASPTGTLSIPSPSPTATLRAPTAAPTATVSTQTPAPTSTLATATSGASPTAATPTGSPTATLGTPSPTLPASTAAPTATHATASPPRTPLPAPPPAFLPYAGLRDQAAASAPVRVWGAQLAGDHYPEIHAANALVELRRMRQHGIASIRTHVHWAAIEPDDRSPEAYDWAETDRRLLDYAQAGLDVVASLVDYPPWAAQYRCGAALHPGGDAAWREFAGAAAARYGRPPYSVVAFEIGNEVDGVTFVEEDDWARPPEWGRGEPTVPHGGCWGDRPAAYVAFLASAEAAIRAAAPGARVTLGNLALVDLPGFDAGFLEGFLTAGGAAHVDYVGFHWFPDLAGFFPDLALPDGPAKVRQVADALARHGVRRPIWLTETYRLTREGDPESELAQLDFVTKGLVELAATTPLQRVYWYGWRDFEGVAPGAFQRGLVRAGHQPKAALASGALRTMIEATDGTATDASTPDVVAYRFLPVRGGGPRYAAWSRTGAPAVLHLPPPSERGTVAETVRFVPSGSTATAERSVVTAGADGFRIPVGGPTTFITFRAP